MWLNTKYCRSDNTPTVNAYQIDNGSIATPLLHDRGKIQWQQNGYICLQTREEIRGRIENSFNGKAIK